LRSADGDEFSTDLGGFYVQEEQVDFDGNSNTSEGIFVYAPSGIDVDPGDIVRVTGIVSEYYGLTELGSPNDLKVCSSGNLPAPTQVPTIDVATSEAFEGMLVQFPQDLYISEYYNFGRYGEIVLCADQLFQPTAVADPDSPEAAEIAAHNASVCITLDDARTVHNPDPARHPRRPVFHGSPRQGPQDALYEVNPYRSSDHDPVIVGLKLTPGKSGSANGKNKR
jgi:predicted extracellular nuclease